MHAHGDDMQAGVGRLRLEAEHVAVGDVVGDGVEVALEILLAAELEVLAAGETGNGLGDVFLQAIEGGDGGGFGEAQRRGEQAEAVVGLGGGVLLEVDVGIVGVAAHAAVRGAGS